MRTRTKIIAAVVGVGVPAASYAWKWRQNQAERRVRSEIPDDVVEGYQSPLEELRAFQHLSDGVCMARCCYTPLTDDEIASYGFAGGDSDTPFSFGSSA